MIIQRQLKYLYENTIIPHVVPELEEIQVNRCLGVPAQTILNVTDNTGALTILCIRVLCEGKKYAGIGDIVLGTVKESLPGMIIESSDIIRAVIVRTKKPLYRENGKVILFDDNAVVIVDSENNPLGTRIFGPVGIVLPHTQNLKVKYMY
jgi:large subunit ribosomal protein L14